MNYRKKNESFHQNDIISSSHSILDSIVSHPDFFKKVDFFGTLKKEMNVHQIENKIVPE
jgi:hypothetical protein